MWQSHITKYNLLDTNLARLRPTRLLSTSKCARCEDTFKDQDLIVVHMIYHMLLKSYCEHQNAINKVSMHYAELGAFIL